MRARELERREMAESQRIRRCHGSEEEEEEDDDEEEAGENENGRRRDGSDLEEVGKAIKNWSILFSRKIDV